MNWAEFEAAAPQLAAGGRERFASAVALLGSLRADGSPRISPIEVVFAAGHLLFGVMTSVKAGDLARDPRCTLHSAVTDPNGRQGEFKLFGRALIVEDPALRDAGDGWWKAYPPEQSSVYSMDIESAALVAWNFGTMTKEVMRWSPAKGVTTKSERYP